MLARYDNKALNFSISAVRKCIYLTSEPFTLNRARKRFTDEQFKDTKNALVSVYIPTHNRKQMLLERSLPSVLAQTYGNLEVIVVADQCTDGTVEAVKAIDDHRVRCIEIGPGTVRYPPVAEYHWFAGPVVAANAALDAFSGDWVARIDDDDVWTLDHVDVLLHYAVLNNLEFVSSAYLAEREGNQTIVDCANVNPRIGGTQTWLYRHYLRTFRYNIDCWRKTWDRVNDLDLQSRLAKAGVRHGFVDQVLAHVMPRPGETTIGLDAYKRNRDSIESAQRNRQAQE